MSDRSGLLFTELEACTVFQISPEQVTHHIAHGLFAHIGDTLSGVALYRQRGETPA